MGVQPPEARHPRRIADEVRFEPFLGEVLHIIVKDWHRGGRSPRVAPLLRAPGPLVRIGLRLRFAVLSLAAGGTTAIAWLGS